MRAGLGFAAAGSLIRTGDFHGDFNEPDAIEKLVSNNSMSLALLKCSEFVSIFFFLAFSRHRRDQILPSQ